MFTLSINLLKAFNMRKLSFYLLLTFIITSCDSKEELTSKKQAINNPTQTYIINGDIEYISEITDGSKPKKPILVYDIPKDIFENQITQNTTSKTSEQSVNINFNYGIADYTKSGCTVTRYMQSGKTFETDAGVYGPNPAPQIDGYLVRGYRTPHHNPSYGSLVLMAGNRGQKKATQRGEFHDNTPDGGAISIEYPFEANVTYEISIRATFHDNRYFIDNIYSNGYPTLYVQLKDDGIIKALSERNQTEDPCDRNGLIFIDDRYNSNVNYTRSYTPDSRSESQKDIIFKFSPTEKKNALLISLYPTLGPSGYDTLIPTNSYTMILPLITITKKPFDSSLNVDVPVIPGRR